MATKRREKISRPAKEWHIYFQFIMKRLRERTGRLEKAVNRVLADGEGTGDPSSQRDFALHNYYVVREFNGEKS